jgi:RNA polymerase sigma-70 factor (ECF subfamily)
MPKTDEDFIKGAQSGQPEAFEALLNRHYETIFKFAYKWCGDKHDAEDIAQQACIKMARGIHQFRFESNFSTWLYRLVINCAKDWQRSQSRHNQHSEDDLQMIDSGDNNVPEKSILLDQLLTRLESFSDGMKETLLLVHAEGFTHGEAGNILGIKESTVSWRLHEIRKHFQSLLGQEGL